MLNWILSIFGLLRRVFFLFFYPEVLIKLPREHSSAADPKQLEENIRLVHSHVFRALRISGGTAFFSVLLYVFFKLLGVHFEHGHLLLARFFGYFFVLWGLFSPTGWKIQTIGRETMPEVIDEEWHRLIYMLGLFLLLSSYLLEIRMEPVVAYKLDNSTAMLNRFVEGFKSWPLKHYVSGYFVSAILGHIVIYPVNRWMRSERNRRQPAGAHTIDQSGLLSWLVGLTERVAFTTALIADYPHFIGLWLTLKFAGRWKEWKPEEPGGWGRVNIFLVGNMLSILFSFIGAVFIRRNLFF